MSTRARASLIVNRPADEVWEAVRAFDFPSRLVSSVSAVSLEGAGATDVGAVRKVTWVSGETQWHRLLAVDDVFRQTSWELVAAEPPAEGSATMSVLRVVRVTETDTCMVEWQAEFSADVSAELVLFTQRAQLHSLQEIRGSLQNASCFLPGSSGLATAGRSRSRPVVIAGPSGVGKSTLIGKLQAKYPRSFGFSVSHTTRQPRPTEEDGVHYHFVSIEEYNRLRDQGGFIEHACFAANHYGTSVSALERVQSSGRVPLLDIDLQGVRQVRDKSNKDPELDPAFIFIKPPSMEELQKRLVGRGDTNAEAIDRRLATAAVEIKASQEEPHLFDWIIVSDDLDRTYQEFEQAIISINPHFDHL